MKRSREQNQQHTKMTHGLKSKNINNTEYVLDKFQKVENNKLFFKTKITENIFFLIEKMLI